MWSATSLGLQFIFCNDYGCWTSFQCAGFSFRHWVIRVVFFVCLFNISIYSGYLCITSSDCCNKFLKVGWFKTNLLVHTSGSEKFEIMVSAGPCSVWLLQGRRVPSFQPLELAGSPWPSLVHRCITPVTWPSFPHMSSCHLPSISACLCVWTSSLSEGHQSHWISPT